MEMPSCSSHALLPLDGTSGYQVSPWVPVQVGLGVFRCSQCGWFFFLHYDREEDRIVEDGMPPSAACLFAAGSDAATILAYRHTEDYLACRTACYRWVCAYFDHARYDNAGVFRILLDGLASDDLKEIEENLNLFYLLLGNAGRHFSAQYSSETPADAVAIVLPAVAPILRWARRDPPFTSSMPPPLAKWLRNQALRVLRQIWEMDVRSLVSMDEQERRELRALLGKQPAPGTP